MSGLASERQSSFPTEDAAEDPSAGVRKSRQEGNGERGEGTPSGRAVDGGGEAPEPSSSEPKSQERFMPPFPPWLPTPPYYTEWQHQERERERLQREERERRLLSPQNAPSEVVSQRERPAFDVAGPRLQGDAAENAPSGGVPAESLRNPDASSGGESLRCRAREEGREGNAGPLDGSEAASAPAASSFRPSNQRSSLESPRDVLLRILDGQLRLTLASAEAVNQLCFVSMALLFFALLSVCLPRSAVVEVPFLPENSMAVAVPALAVALACFFIARTTDALRAEISAVRRTAEALSAFGNRHLPGRPVVGEALPLLEEGEAMVSPAQDSSETEARPPREELPSTEDGPTEGSSGTTSGGDPRTNPLGPFLEKVSSVRSTGFCPTVSSEALSSLLLLEIPSVSSLCNGLFRCGSQGERRGSADTEVAAEISAAAAAGEEALRVNSEEREWSSGSSSVSWSNGWGCSDDEAKSDKAASFVRATDGALGVEVGSVASEAAPDWKALRHLTARHPPPPFSTWPQPPLYLRAVVEPWIQKELRNRRRNSQVRKHPSASNGRSQSKSTHSLLLFVFCVQKSFLRYKLPMPPLHLLSAHLPVAQGGKKSETQSTKCRMDVFLVKKQITIKQCMRCVYSNLLF